MNREKNKWDFKIISFAFFSPKLSMNKLHFSIKTDRKYEQNDGYLCRTKYICSTQRKNRSFHFTWSIFYKSLINVKHLNKNLCVRIIDAESWKEYCSFNVWRGIQFEYFFGIKSLSRSRFRAEDPYKFSIVF